MFPGRWEGLYLLGQVKTVPAGGALRFTTRGFTKTCTDMSLRSELF